MNILLEEQLANGYMAVKGALEQAQQQGQAKDTRITALEQENAELRAKLSRRKVKPAPTEAPATEAAV